MVLECSAAIKESGNRYLRLMEIDIHFCYKYIFALLEIHIYFCFTWKVSIFFLLSSGPVDCSDQKGIDDPFSGLIDMERHLFRFHIGSLQWWWSQAKPQLKSIYIGFALPSRGKTIWWKMGQVIYSSKSNFIACQGQNDIIGT